MYKYAGQNTLKEGIRDEFANLPTSHGEGLLVGVRVKVT